MRKANDTPPPLLAAPGGRGSIRRIESIGAADQSADRREGNGFRPGLRVRLVTADGAECTGIACWHGGERPADRRA
ncbi:hypothetical protein J4558_09360 [Leptolyngbya sp. 15MV]|nr:hypothetical protein J4558_09360 [Leptolyngbya sp. 15MV]